MALSQNIERFNQLNWGVRLKKGNENDEFEFEFCLTIGKRNKWKTFEVALRTPDVEKIEKGKDMYLTVSLQT